MKNERIGIRVSILDKKIIAKKAEGTGLHTSEYLRQLALSYEPKNKLTQDEIDSYKVLHTYAHHFTNISNMYKRQDPSINDEVRFVINLFKTHLTKFQ